MSERPMKTLEMIMNIKPAHHVGQGVNQYVFPLMVFDDDSVALLVPLPEANRVFANIDAIMPTVRERVALVSIPYHPEPDEDESIYSFDVFLTFVGSNTPAIAEMLILQKYARELWDKYRHLATPFSWEAS